MRAVAVAMSPAVFGLARFGQQPVHLDARDAHLGAKVKPFGSRVGVGAGVGVGPGVGVGRGGGASSG